MESNWHKASSFEVLRPIQWETLSPEGRDPCASDYSIIRDQIFGPDSISAPGHVILGIWARNPGASVGVNGPLVLGIRFRGKETSEKSQHTQGCGRCLDGGMKSGTI